MVVISQSSAISSGLIQAKLPFQSRRYSSREFNNFNGVKAVVPSGRIFRGGIRKCCVSGFGTNCAVRMGRDSYQSSFDDDLPQEPFPLTLVKEFIWGIRSLFVFLVEQPSQLKFVEWPGFSSTVCIRNSEDRYSHSCSCGAADCGTYVNRLCPQLSVGFTSKENPVTEFTDRTMMIQLRCWVLFSASCIMRCPVMAVSLSNNGASRDEHHRFKSCNKPCWVTDFDSYMFQA
ncbi:hypothetical protein TIFTF001_007466 [Ficus carica]|uniref:Uncharacterized protein n=1 Tax=Ficus carica TaxID=3494 RepID=A0AA88A6M6_FICCA|nr:hypothetical protein TIFTF001_007466 [Ficus carica]